MVSPEPSPRQDDRFWAIHDRMTGLLNREGLNERLAYLIENQPGRFGVLMIDLDSLTRVNNTSGHESGDQLITEAAQAIGEVTRQESGDSEQREPDTLAIGRISEAARTGGDEFIMPLSGVNTDEKLRIVSSRIDSRLRQDDIHASIGGAVHQKAMDATLLLSLADEAMYRDKNARKIERQSATQLHIIKQIGALAAEHEIDPYDIPAVLTALRRRASRH